MYNTDPIAFKRELKSRNMKICLILLLIMGIIAGVIKSSIREIKLYSTKQMEIIRPYIGEKQYFTLCSDYLRIKNKEDFDNFLKNLYAHADAIAKDIAKHDPKAKPFKIEKFKE